MAAQSNKFSGMQWLSGAKCQMVSNWSWEPLHIGTPSISDATVDRSPYAVRLVPNLSKTCQGPDANSNEDLHTLFDGLASLGH